MAVNRDLNMHNTQNIPADILAQVKKCAAVMRAGGIAAYPTDTVYGLGADVLNREAVAKVFAAKQRPLNIPLPVLIADTSQLNELTAGIPPLAKMLMDKFWPGALTIIFNKAIVISKIHHPIRGLCKSPVLGAPAIFRTAEIMDSGHAISLGMDSA